MTRILFVCHGNICRSPMAEYILKYRIERNRIPDIEVASAATSTEEIGNDIYPPAKRKLTEKGVPFRKREARQVTKTDYSYYDKIICMDNYNLSNLKRFYSGDPDGKIQMLLERPVSDPWYTGDFESTYNDLSEGIDKLLEEIRERK